MKQSAFGQCTYTTNKVHYMICPHPKVTEDHTNWSYVKIH